MNPVMIGQPIIDHSVSNRTQQGRSSVLTDTSYALTTLSTEYTIVGNPIRLSLSSGPDSEQKIFDQLMALYRAEFAPNERIIIIQDTAEIYSYLDNVACDSLIFLQKSLQTIDISNFFVIVISGNQQIQMELDWVQQHYSTDDIPMHGYRIDVPYTKHYVKKDTFCVLPWMHLHVTTQLDVAACCRADQEQPWGNLKNNTVIDIVNSERANAMRSKMLRGMLCSECKNCYALENAGQESSRIKENRKYRDLRSVLIDNTASDGSLRLYQPLTLDLRLNNTCNLKCRTCNGVSSSQIAQEEKKLFNNTINLDRTPTKILRLQVLDKVRHYVDHAESIIFAGGEPMLMHEHFAILEQLINQGKTDVRLSYTTNFTTFMYKDKNVLDLWQQFHNVNVLASIDGHGAVFEYVRHGARWQDIEQNLASLQTACPHVKLEVFSTVSIFSAESVMELQKKWHQARCLDITKFRLNPISANDYFSLCTLFPHHKAYLSEKINDHVDWLQQVGADRLVIDWKNIQQTMWQTDKKYMSLMIAQVNRARDIERNENFESLFPQFADLFSADSTKTRFNLA